MEVMEFQLSYFKSGKMMLWKCFTQYASKFGKLSSGHRAGKGQFSFQIPKKGNAKECSNYCTIALISHASKVMVKILHARLQRYVNRELLDVPAGFRKGRGTRDQISNICWIIEKAREFQKNISVQFSSVTQSRLTLCNPMDCSMPGLPVHHQLPELTQTHVHWVGYAIQTSHPLSSPSPPAFNPSQHQGLFQWVRSSHQVAKVLEFQLQHRSFQWIFRTDFL